MHELIACRHVGRSRRRELAGVRKRRDARPMADLVRQASSDAGDHSLIAQEAVDAHRVRREQCGELLGLDSGGLGAELVERR